MGVTHLLGCLLWHYRCDNFHKITRYTTTTILIVILEQINWNITTLSFTRKLFVQGISINTAFNFNKEKLIKRYLQLPPVLFFHLHSVIPLTVPSLLPNAGLHRWSRERSSLQKLLLHRRKLVEDCSRLA